MRGDMTPREERVRARAQRLWQEAADALRQRWTGMLPAMKARLLQDIAA